MVMAFIGLFFALLFVFFRIEKYDIKFSSFIKMFVCCIVGVLVGSKTLFAITQLGWLRDNYSLENMLLLIPQSGYVFYGGLFGVIIALCIYTRGNLDYRKRVFRMVVPAIPLFHAFGRIGCLFAGCCYGKKLSQSITFWGITFDRIPTQVIEAILELLLFVALVIIDKKRKNANLLTVYLLSYATIRFSGEFFRGDTIRGIFGGLSTSQWISLAIFLFYVARLIKMMLFERRKDYGII
jgi:phosphatidylglycerol:prolipoprotein diacylglycerol transferase